MQREVHSMEEEGRRGKIAQMSIQGLWMKWDTIERKMTWEDVWQYQPLELYLLIRAAYELLPTPSNLTGGA